MSEAPVRPDSSEKHVLGGFVHRGRALEVLDVLADPLDGRADAVDHGVARPELCDSEPAEVV
jgi:hypothetical protein